MWWRIEWDNAIKLNSKYGAKVLEVNRMSLVNVPKYSGHFEQLELSFPTPKPQTHC
jgi:hypothetical protein